MTRGLVLALACLLLTNGATAAAEDPLPSWRGTPIKEAIVSFVLRTTSPDSPDFVAEADRVAVFDNDGTLWAEQPLYFQLFFAFDRIRSMAPDHPDMQTTEPFASILKNDIEGALSGGTEALFDIVAKSHADMSVTAFQALVSDWLATARHPTTGRPFTKMVYQPMLEMLAYLRTHGYKTYIVSGGGIEFMRPWVESVYGIPPQQVVGSSIKTQYVVLDGVPQLLRLPEVAFVDDKDGKPVGINKHIGRRPVIAFGNSDGDFQMLEYTTAGDGARLGVLIHHTDAAREWKYDRESHIGRLNRGLDEAEARAWLVVDMKRDWGRVFPD